MVVYTGKKITIPSWNIFNCCATKHFWTTLYKYKHSTDLLSARPASVFIGSIYRAAMTNNDDTAD